MLFDISKSFAGQINVLSSKEKENKNITLRFTSHRYEPFAVLDFYLTYVVDNALNYR